MSAAKSFLPTIVIFALDVSEPSQLILVEIMLFIAGFCIYAINGIVFTYASDIGGRIFSGTCSGILNFAAYLGAAVQSVVYGFILDNGGWGIVFVSVAAFELVVAALGVLGSLKSRRQT